MYNIMDVINTIIALIGGYVIYWVTGKKADILPNHFNIIIRFCMFFMYFMLFILWYQNLFM